MRLAVVAVAFALACAPLGAGAATIRGVAALPGVVWVSGGVPGAAIDAEIRQSAKAFIPGVLVVPAGSSVKFPNDDAFYHSVYSVSPSNPFDLGLYDTGPGKSVVFGAAGVVEVRCHIHGSMHATIVVVDGPYAVTTRPAEAYQLSVSAGAHVLHVWADGSPVTSTKVVVR